MPLQVRSARAKRASGASIQRQIAGALGKRPSGHERLPRLASHRGRGGSWFRVSKRVPCDVLWLRRPTSSDCEREYFTCSYTWAEQREPQDRSSAGMPRYITHVERHPRAKKYRIRMQAGSSRQRIGLKASRRAGSVQAAETLGRSFFFVFFDKLEGNKAQKFNSGGTSSIGSEIRPS